MPSESLGIYYESLLDKEVRKEDGIYYTPPLIVDYMVAESVGTLLKDKTPDEAEKIKIVDPSCGGGAFVLSPCDGTDGTLLVNVCGIGATLCPTPLCVTLLNVSVIVTEVFGDEKLKPVEPQPQPL